MLTLLNNAIWRQFHESSQFVPEKKNQNFYLCTFTSSNKLDSRDQSVTKSLSSKGKKLMAFAHKWNFLVEI